MQLEIAGNSESIVRRLLSEGGFGSPGEVVARALDFYELHRPTMDSLRAKIQEGLDDAAAGRERELDVEDLIARNEARRDPGAA